MFQVIAYINYWLRQVDAHSLHSPFLFDLYNEIIAQKPHEHPEIEKLRSSLYRDSTKIELTDFGAGSRLTESNIRTVASVAKHSATPQKFSNTLKQLIAHFQFKNIVELGTSLGLNTLYMAQNQDTRITTFEGDSSLAKLAEKHFYSLSASNIEIIEGNIDATLPPFLESAAKIDLAYIDANHSYEPTLRYFELLLPKMSEKGIIIFDDIHWSKGMNDAWDVIKRDKRANLSIDLFEAGLLFIDPSLPKEDYILKY